MSFIQQVGKRITSSLIKSFIDSSNSLKFSFSSHPPPSGTSHIRVRPGPGLSGGVQIHYQSRLQNLQNPDSVSSTLQNTSNIPVNIREYKPADTNIQSNPTAGGAGYTGPDGSTDMSSDPVIHTSSDCGSLYGSSVHQGIMRGTNTVSTQIFVHVTDSVGSETEGLNT